MCRRRVDQFAVVKGEDEKLHLFIDGELDASSEEASDDFDDMSYEVVLGVLHQDHPRYFLNQSDVSSV